MRQWYFFIFQKKNERIVWHLSYSGIIWQNPKISAQNLKMPIQKLAAEHFHHNRRRQAPTSHTQPHLPLVVTLNCLEDPGFEQDTLSGLATVEHIDLSQITTGRIESASVIILHSLAFLPRAAQRRIQQWQLVLCLGSADRAVDSVLAADLGLKLVHVDANRSEEIADTIMALFLGLLRRTHALSGQVSAVAASSSGWLGSIQPVCKGMRRCRGLVLGIIGRSASAKCLAIRSLAFRMSVLYFDVHIEVMNVLFCFRFLWHSSKSMIFFLNN